MTAAFTLAALVYFNVIHIWHVLALSVMTGMAQAFGGPAYQSLLPSLVKTEHVPNAIAFNSIQFQLSRVIGALTAGVTFAAFGMVVCFGLNGISFMAVIVAILSLHVRHVPPSSSAPMRDQLQGGFEYVRANHGLIGLAVLGFATMFLGNPLLTFLPVFTKDVFGGGVNQYTYLMAAAGGGAAVGALVVAWLGRFRHMGRTLLIIQFLFGLVMVTFALLRVFWVNAIVLFVAGGCMVMVTAMLSSLVQLNAPNEMRGRVMSIYMVAFRGGMPLGSLVAGWAATRSSAPSVLIVNGVLLTVVSAWFLLKSHGVREL